LGEKRGGIQIEVEDSRKSARRLPLVIFVTDRHERQLSSKISQRRSGGAVNKCLSLVALAAFVNSKKMGRPIEAAFDALVGHRLNEFSRHAAPVWRRTASCGEISTTGGFAPRLVQSYGRRICGGSLHPLRFRYDWQRRFAVSHLPRSSIAVMAHRPIWRVTTSPSPVLAPMTREMRFDAMCLSF
jgi:hypothetical protein